MIIDIWIENDTFRAGGNGVEEVDDVNVFIIY